MSDGSSADGRADGTADGTAGETGYKVCPECREEYRLEALRCAECDVELVSAEAWAAERRALEDFPPVSQLACVRVAPVAWIRALSEGLEEAGIPHRVEPATPEDAPPDQRASFGDSQLFGLYVKPEHRDAARELDDAIAAQVLPEGAPDLESGEEDACPACGSPLGSDAIECSDCGLVLG